MAESSLDKVLRLAAAAGGRKTVPVRQYQRVEQGRLQVVRQHVQGHATGGGPHLVAAGALKAGNVVQLGRIQYSVVSVKPYVRKPASAKSGPNTKGTVTGKNTGSQGQGVNTGGPQSTASAGAGVAAAADPQAILDAAAKAAKIPFGAPEIEIVLRQPGSNSDRGVLTPKATPVLVVR